MQDINTVNITGRFVRDIEMKYTNSGMAIGSFALAVNGRKKVGDSWEDEANFIDCTLFGKQADALAKYLVKGKQVAVTGRLKQDRWEKDGQKRSKLGVIVDSIVLFGGGESKGGDIHHSNTSINDGLGEDDIPF